ncbi:MAG: OmpA family protein [Gammaproteobacteria bacterium]|nr:OmpA family protein [Gammaproteobacteria bacterium]
MRSNPIVPTLLVIGATLMGCSTVPEKHAVLEEARSNYLAAQSNPDVTKHAAVELQQAGKALESAENAWSKKEDEELVDHLAYLAKQRALIAQDTGKLRAAEMDVVSADERRDAVRLELRTAEADAARKQVGIAQEAAVQQAQETAAAEALRERSKLRQAEITAAAAAQAAAELGAATTRVSEMEKELAELNARKTERGLVITLGDVLFDVNQAELKPGSERNVQKIADFLREYPERKVLIEGFTDSTGSESYNQVLSERRAEAVRTFLIRRGVSADRVAARGYGESNPVASNATAATRQLNRRVEIVISEDEREVDPR